MVPQSCLNIDNLEGLRKKIAVEAGKSQPDFKEVKNIKLQFFQIIVVYMGEYLF